MFPLSNFLPTLIPTRLVLVFGAESSFSPPLKNPFSVGPTCYCGSYMYLL